MPTRSLLLLVAMLTASLSSVARADEARRTAAANPAASSHATARAARIALYVEQINGFSARTAELSAAEKKYRAVGNKAADAATASGRIDVRAGSIYLRDEIDEVIAAAQNDQVLALDGPCDPSLTAAIERLVDSLRVLRRINYTEWGVRTIQAATALNERLARCRPRMIK